MNSCVMTASKKTHPSPNAPVVPMSRGYTSVPTVLFQRSTVPPAWFTDMKTSHYIVSRYVMLHRTIPFRLAHVHVRLGVEWWVL